jgi:hypothetical protein
MRVACEMSRVKPNAPRFVFSIALAWATIPAGTSRLQSLRSNTVSRHNLIAGKSTRLRIAALPALVIPLLVVGFATGCGKQSHRKSSLLEISSVNKIANRAGGYNAMLGFAA